MFVDSDDYVEQDFCKIPFEIAERNDADIVVFCYRSFLNNKVEIKKYNHIVTDGIISKQQLIDNLHGMVGNSVWNKLYKKYLFDGVYFPDAKLREDVYTLCKLVVKSDILYFTDTVLYNYVKTVDSISRTPSLEWKYESIEAFYYQMTFFTGLGYKYTVSKHSLLRALRYLIYSGFDGSLSSKSTEIIVSA